ncbi:phosphate signaling complex protein PhoU [Amorphoplanes digitatis]|uniref:Phosphate-specific transport system accessory protein PhoU n=1 Tax=Actinoplanes digitatis TaxID=1868 RepID=A0A7W7I236_9ACTN|nr:phosphate signaling complex protein PhoU [Actinoplanes digitatis]MBB4764853.1 phosphate transport system protein [Actinoplanes digitatis]GID91191.1 phosphate transport system regulatory protein PhoU [Actinoplanes digitatis]
MREDFQAELDRVSSTLVTMAMAARETMRQASTALITADHTVALQVTARDAEIDVLYRVAEDRAYDLVARRQPVADDLRKAVTSIQVAADLRRMGGLAVHVARSVLRRHPAPAVVPELAELFQAMGTVADGLAGKIVSALSDHDAVLAAQLDRDDDAMDHLYQRLFAVLLSPDWPMGVEAAIDGALLGRYYERYADNAVNVGHHVVALITGKTD